jgi:hypothetical protein
LLNISPLELAVTENPSMVSMLLQHVKSNQQESLDRALMRAVDKRDPILVGKLLDANTEPKTDQVLDKLLNGFSLQTQKAQEDTVIILNSLMYSGRASIDHPIVKRSLPQLRSSLTEHAELYRRIPVLSYKENPSPR